MSIVPNIQRYDGKSIQQQIHVSIDAKKSGLINDLMTNSILEMLNQEYNT